MRRRLRELTGRNARIVARDASVSQCADREAAKDALGKRGGIEIPGGWRKCVYSNPRARFSAARGVKSINGWKNPDEELFGVVRATRGSIRD